MKNHVKELTEGMQRLCAVANRVVQSASPHRIDIDLLLENLRSLYEVANSLIPGPSPVGEGSEMQGVFTPLSNRIGDGGEAAGGEADDMAKVLTIAAMQPEQDSLTPDPSPIGEGSKEQEVSTPLSNRRGDGGEALPEPTPEPMPPMEELEQNDNALLFDEVIIDSLTPDPSPVGEGSGKQEVSTPLSNRREDGGEAASGDSVGQVSLLDYLGQPAQRTLGESLVADRPQTSSLERKVDDLRTVININDKFSFMSELFHNNMKAYNDFIMSLNAMASRDEAMEYVRGVAAQQKWDDASATVQEFYKVFDKKF